MLNKIGFKNISASDVFFPTKVNFFNSNKPNKICDIDLIQFNDDLNKYTLTKRSTLLKFLLENIPRDNIKFNTVLKNLDYSNTIKARFSDESEEHFDFIIIADGVFSQSKSIISKESLKPKYNNSIALRESLINMMITIFQFLWDQIFTMLFIQLIKIMNIISLQFYKKN